MADKELLRRIRDNGPYVVVGGKVRQRNAPFRALRANIMSLVASGHLKVISGRLCLTNAGFSALNYEKTHSKTYAAKMADRGYVRKSVWVHKSDLRNFEDFMTGLKDES